MPGSPFLPAGLKDQLFPSPPSSTPRGKAGQSIPCCHGGYVCKQIALSLSFPCMKEIFGGGQSLPAIRRSFRCKHHHGEGQARKSIFPLPAPQPLPLRVPPHPPLTHRSPLHLMSGVKQSALYFVLQGGSVKEMFNLSLTPGTGRKNNNKKSVSST